MRRDELKVGIELVTGEKSWAGPMAMYTEERYRGVGGLNNRVDGEGCGKKHVVMVDEESPRTFSARRSVVSGGLVSMVSESSIQDLALTVLSLPNRITSRDFGRAMR